MSRRQQLAAAAAVVSGALAAGALFLHLRGDGAERADETGAASLASANDLRAAQTITRHEQRSVAVPLLTASAGTIGAALAERLGRAHETEQAIDEARAGRISPVELGHKLRQATAGHPELGGGLLRALDREGSPAIALQLSRALAGLEDDPALRAETVASLRAGGPTRRAVGLLALLGRSEPEVVQLANDTLASDSTEARATAAFLLNSVPAAIDEEALVAARQALRDAGAGARLREQAATMLGRAGAPEADVALLERSIFEGEPAVRMRALAAFAATEADGVRMAAIFERAASDSNGPERLREMARAWRAGRR